MSRAALLAAMLLMPSTAWAAEAVCSLPTTLFCEDWETTTLGVGDGNSGRWWENANPGSHLITTNLANVFQGARALQATFTANQDSAGWLTTWLTPSGAPPGAPTAGYDHIFSRVYWKLQSGWQCQTTGAVGQCGKLTPFYGIQSGLSGPFNPYSAHGQAGVCPSGTDFFYAGLSTGAPPPFDFYLYEYHSGMTPDGNGQCFGDAYHGGGPTSVPIPTGTYVCFEQEVQANTPGQSNGFHRLWVNDVLARERLNIRWRDTSNLQMGAFLLSFSLTPPQTQQLWVDNIVVATQRIGCAGSSPVARSIAADGLAYAITGVDAIGIHTLGPTQLVFIHRALLAGVVIALLWQRRARR